MKSERNSSSGLGAEPDDTVEENLTENGGHTSFTSIVTEVHIARMRKTCTTVCKGNLHSQVGLSSNYKTG